MAREEFYQLATTGDIYRLAMLFDMPQEQEAYNVIGLKQTSGSCTDAELLAAVGTWVNTLYQTLQAVINNTVDVQEGRLAKMIWTGTKWLTDAIIGTVYPTFTATDATEMLPHAVAGLLTLPTADPKRKGKVYIPGLTEAQQNGSYLGGAALTALGNFGTALRTGLTPGTASVYYHVLGDDGTARFSTGYTVNGLVSSQRRRKPGVGV